MVTSRTAGLRPGERSEVRRPARHRRPDRLLRGLPAAGRYVDGLAAVPTCSEVTRVEVLRGMRAHERRGTERFLATIGWSAVDERISGLAGELGRRFRRSHGGIGVVDLVIAATAQQFVLP